MSFWINVTIAFVAFGITAMSGFIVIPFLRKLKAGQTILDIGPKWHKAKEGTPTMGGFMFVFGTLIALILGYVLLAFKNEVGDNGLLKLALGLVMSLLFMFVGFVDDYIKVVKKRNLGLRAKQKLVFQILIALSYLIALYFLDEKNTNIPLPFFGDVNFSYFYFPIMVGFIIFMVNSVNLTDGIDGLCTTVTLVVSLAFGVLFLWMGNTTYTIFTYALAGACFGFLIWNLKPAKVFMGDTGSMFLGGCVVAFAFASKNPLILILIGIIYVCESLSVIIQVISFKSTGKRVFKMSPIHHHFELSKWSEYKIVIVFSLITLISSVSTVYYIIITTKNILSAS